MECNKAITAINIIFQTHKFITYNSIMKSKSRSKQAVFTSFMVLPVISLMFIWGEAVGLPNSSGYNLFSATGSSSSLVPASEQDGVAEDKGKSLPTPRVEKITVSMSAYTSRVEETDSTPCISADGTNICKYDGCIVASNDYPFDTILDVEGFGKCVVKDRMSSRYTGTGNMDIYFRYDLEGALQFGRQNLKIKITS